MSESQSLVIVIDDDPDIREALGCLLETVGLPAKAFASAAEFLASKPIDGPCCIVLDVRLPGLGGLEFQRQLTQRKIPTPVIFITGHGDVPMSVSAMKAGAFEFLTKPIRDQEFLDAVQAALSRDGERLKAEHERAELCARYKMLSAREKEVMDLLAAGLVSKQIAAELALSDVTVRLHRLHLMGKMQVSSLADLIRAADKIRAIDAETVPR